MFDIIVPTYNRYNALPDFFKKLELLDRSRYTLWIIDDCSPDKNISVIPNWPNIKYIQLTENIGQAGARNYAIEHGTAPYIISLDDDAWFMPYSPTFDAIVSAFDEYTETGCFMFNIATPKTKFEKDVDGLLLPVHVTCGCAYRRQALEEIKGFNSLIQGQSEESDISLKLYKAGWQIRSLYSVHVFHDFNPEIRSIDWYTRIRYKETRNCLVVAYIHYPATALLWALPGKAVNQLIFAVRSKIAVGKTVTAELKAIAEFIGMVPRLKKFRNPLSKQQFDSWRSLYK